MILSLTIFAGALFIGLSIVDIILRDAIDALFESLVVLLFVALLFGGFAS
jgi:hypothetical protein